MSTVNEDKFQELWKITKDHIEICRDCELKASYFFIQKERLKLKHSIPITKNPTNRFNKLMQVYLNLSVIYHLIT